MRTKILFRLSKIFFGKSDKPLQRMVKYTIRKRSETPPISKCEIYCPRCQRHISKRWILSGGGGHTCAVGNKHILAGMQLVPFIEQRGLWVLAHAYATHFMNIKTWSLF